MHVKLTDVSRFFPIGFLAAPTPSPTAVYSPARAAAFTSDDVSQENVQDLTDPEAAGGLLDSAAATERQGEVHVSDNPEDLELPRQIHIQQHLKLHFHPQGKSSRAP